MGLFDMSYNTDALTADQWRQFGASGGTIGAGGQMLDSTGAVVGDLARRGGLAEMVDGTSLQGVGQYLSDTPVSELTGLAGLGLSAYNQLFGGQNDLFKEQLGLLRDKRAANQEALANRRSVNESLATGFNQAFK